MTVTRKDIEKSYKVTPRSLIVSPGKFEREMIYVPYFYVLWTDGSASADEGSVGFFEIEPEDRQVFPELDSCYGIALEESEQGFVSSVLYPTKEEYDAALRSVRDSEINS